MKSFAQEIQSDPKVRQQVISGHIPKFVIEKWLKEQKGKKRGLPKLVNGILTVIYGLYGYGWHEETRKSQAGNMILYAVELNRDHGIHRLAAGEDPLIPNLRTTVVI